MAGFIQGEPSVLLTVFDPARGGINCGESCHVLADTYEWTPDDYGFIAACPDWMVFTGRYRVAVDVAGMQLVCRDAGPLVNISWNEYYETYVIHIDVMYHLPEYEDYPSWNYSLFPLDDVAFSWENIYGP